MYRSLALFCAFLSQLQEPSPQVFKYPSSSSCLHAIPCNKRILFATHVQVRYLKIIEKSGYQALPWVRYITMAGEYELRMI